MTRPDAGLLLLIASTMLLILLALIPGALDMPFFPLPLFLFCAGLLRGSFLVMDQLIGRIALWLEEMRHQ